MDSREDSPLLKDAKHSTVRSGVLFVTLVVIGVVCFALGLLIGHFAIRQHASQPLFLAEADPRISALLVDTISADNIGKHLTRLTAEVHRAGTPESEAVIEYIRQHFVSLGLDEVETPEYDVLLSYPDLKQPDTVEFVNGSSTLLISSGVSGLSTQEERRSRMAGIRFNGYSKPGQLNASRLVYANYGRQEDFELLQQESIVIDKTTVVLIRYGRFWRGGKVQNAQRAGAGAVLLYTDPMDYSNSSTARHEAYPNTLFMLADGTQRGSVLFQTSGDPLTPLLPSKNYTVRRTVEEAIKAEMMSDTPVTPIAYADALELFGLMAGPRAPENFTGALPIEYRLGGSLPQGTLRVSVRTRSERRRIRNVIGTIRGAVEPERVVLLGNHHDAWTYGAVDPNLGTAAMLELAARFVAAMQNSGWRPRRSVAFCAWDAEEYGLIGSAEWVQEHLLSLQRRAVAYLNADVIVDGRQSLRVKSVPLLEELLINASKKVPNPSETEVKAGRTTVFDTWMYYSDPGPKPTVGLLGSGSDFQHMLDYAGVPCADLSYKDLTDPNGQYPLYHSVHETAGLVSGLLDPGYRVAVASTGVWGEAARRLADEPLLPFSVGRYGRRMRSFVARLLADPSVHSKDYGLDFLEEAAADFEAACEDFENNKATALSNRDASSVRRANEVMQTLEQAFLLPGGLPNRPDVRHTVFAPSAVNLYAGDTFPGIRDALTNGSAVYDVKLQVSWVVYGLKQATALLTRSF